MGLATVIIKAGGRLPQGLYARPPSNNFKGGSRIKSMRGRLRGKSSYLT
jgi:hypothetical protein